MKLSKADLEYYAKARPHTRELPGYFKADGTLVRGIFYVAKLGTKSVGYADTEYRSYIEEAGAYRMRSDALQGAKLFQQKMREMLEAGDYLAEERHE